jgi:signal transduction histidine kinase
VITLFSIGILIYLALLHYLDRERRLVDLLQVFVAQQDVATTLDRIAAFCARVADSEICTIMIYSQSHKRLVIVASHGVEAPEDRSLLLAPGEGVNGAAFLRRSSINVPDVRVAIDDVNYVRFRSVGNRVRSEIAFPLLLDDRALGTLNFESFRKDHFSGQVEILAALSQQLPRLIDYVLDAQEQLRRIRTRRDLGLTASRAMQSLAHAFKNDLQVVLPLFEMLDRQLDETSRKMPWAEFRQHVENCRRLLSTRRREINRRLVGQDYQLTSWREYSIGDLARRVVDVARTYLLTSGIVFTFEQAQSVTVSTRFTTDADALDAIITNLLSNAAAAIDRKRGWAGQDYAGRISVQVSGETGGERLRELRLTVEDNGPGIQEKYCRPNGQGFNIRGGHHGLSIISDNLQALGGRAEVETAAREFARIVIVVPDHVGGEADAVSEGGDDERGT